MTNCGERDDRVDTAATFVRRLRSMKPSAVVFGATGLVGGHLVRLLATDARFSSAFSGITLVGRRPSHHPSLDKAGTPLPVVERVADLTATSTYDSVFSNAVVFCCLGTTIKRAGSRDAFRMVDVTLPATLARAASKGGATKFLLVSAVGANASSRVFYNHCKGEAENIVASYTFPKGVVVVRPSLLLGERAESRVGEKLGATVLGPLAPLFVGPAAKFRPITAETVARALANAAILDSAGDSAGLVVYEGEGLFNVANAGAQP